MAGLDHDQMVEEAVAGEFRKFGAALDSVPNALRPIWAKVRDFFRGLLAGIRRIFGASAAGRLHRRGA
jgi:hypothetical protein